MYLLKIKINSESGIGLLMKLGFTEEGKNAVRVLTDQLASLQSKLDEAEHTLNLRLTAPVPRDLDSLEHLVIQHKDFETNLKVRLRRADGK